MPQSNLPTQCCLLVATLLTVCQVTCSFNQWDDGMWRRPRPSRTKSVKPNIVFLITDDQDSELGSMNFMPKTLRILQEGGATFTNAFVTTPMCCPSRSSMLTGRYVHNHNTYTNNDNCSSIQWREMHEPRSFGVYLTNAGYRTGYFGKYLNEYDGDYIPPGWTEWVGLIRNTRFYNYKLNFNGKRVKHENNYYEDYLTDLIANDSVTFLKQSKQYFPNRPVAMVLSMPAPHGPEDSAPQYQNMFMNVTTHRTPSYNFAPNPDKQWLLQYNGKMEPIHMAFTDMLHSKRLQTLQSVDDAVEKLYHELEALGELDNTYIVYSSDHGYHLGQFGLIKGKAMPYEFDIRVPFYMRGPGIPAAVKVPNIALNIDLAPTFLDMAGVPVPDDMDGRSLLKLFDGADSENRLLKKKKAWRDSFLVERGKITKKKILNRERLEAQKTRLQAARLVVTKEERLEQECQKAEYQPPCSRTQEWECRLDGTGKLRMYKCRDPGGKGRLSAVNAYNMPLRDQPAQPPSQLLPRMCPCENMDKKRERKRVRTFLRNHVNQPKLLKHFGYQVSKRRRYKRNSFWGTGGSAESTEQKTPPALQEGPVQCRVLANKTVVCEDSVSPDEDQWKLQKDRLDDMIQRYKEKLEQLKDMRRRLKKERPNLNTSYPYLSEFDTDLNPKPPVQDPPSFINPENPLDPDFDGVGPPNPNPEYEPSNNDNDETKVESPRYDPFDVIDPPVPQEGVQEEDEFDVDDLSDEEVDMLMPPEDVQRLKEEYGHGLEGTEEEDQDELCPCDGGQAEVGVMNEEEEEEDLDRSTKKKRKNTKSVRRERKRKERQRRKEEKNAKRRKNGGGGGGGGSSYEAGEGGGGEDFDDGDEEFPDSGEVDPTRDCSNRNMKCFTHDNDHWKVPPLWDTSVGENLFGRGVGVDELGVGGSGRNNPLCNKEGMECSQMDNDHWNVPPQWTLGPFCFCPNSNNNTYWCLRTINMTSNFLYCEFITGFISYYDMTKDPYQLRNAVYDLSFSVLQQLSDKLEQLKNCQGRACNMRSRIPELELDDDESSGENSGEIPLLDAQTIHETESSGDEAEKFDPEKESFLWWTNAFRLDKDIVFLP